MVPPPTTFSFDAPAKINLNLHITGQRPDGYHLLDSLMVFASDACDRITIEHNRPFSVEVTGAFSHGLDGTDNLVTRAVRLIAEEAGQEPEGRITLDKTLPIGAGLGGGSADAAAVLRHYNTYWKLGYSDAQLGNLALPLGAELPVCIASHTSRVTGIGEVLEAITAPACYAVLVNPGIPVATPTVFQQFRQIAQGTYGSPATLPTSTDPASFLEQLRHTRNDLEPTARVVAPVIADVLAAIASLPHCALARMSGSGGTCFGLFSQRETAEQAAQQLAAEHPQWWVKATGFLP